MPFLPMNSAEVKQRGWDGVDFVYVCGDSYVDHLRRGDNHQSFRGLRL